MASTPDSDDLDGCELEFADTDQVTEDGEQRDALVMFADVWDDPDAVEARKDELRDWADAVEGAG